MLRSRRKAREAALQATYGCDLIQDWSEKMIALYFQIHHPDAESEQATCEHLCFSRDIVRGVAKEIAFLDRHIASVSTNWSIGRMCRIDRNLIRCAAFEIGFIADIPVSVTINEAIELAKEYGGEDSPHFVNGILDKLARHMREDSTLTDVMRSKEMVRTAANQ